MDGTKPRRNTERVRDYAFKNRTTNLNGFPDVMLLL